jgi:hypothetical protein
MDIPNSETISLENSGIFSLFLQLYRPSSPAAAMERSVKSV